MIVFESLDSDFPYERHSAVWIAWERQRRTTELASRLRINLVRIIVGGPRLKRYLIQIPKTVHIILSRRPKLLFVQNPSIILTAVACFFRPILRYKLVVDRHTNFMLQKPHSLKKSLFLAVSDWTLRNADITIVTNSFLAAIVDNAGGHAFVLQDPMPVLSIKSTNDYSSSTEPPFAFFICTYAKDEPYCDVIRAMDRLSYQANLIISGRPPNGGFPSDVEEILRRRPNIHVAGFLSEEEYELKLSQAEFSIVLTTSEHCLVCGAYESISLSRPLLLSDKVALRNYFGDDIPIYVDNSVEGIAEGLDIAFSGRLPAKEELITLKETLEERWRIRFTELKATLQSLQRSEA